MKIRTYLMVILILTTLVLGACSSNQPASNADAPVPPPEEPPAEMPETTNGEGYPAPETGEGAEEESTGEDSYPAPETEAEMESAESAYPVSEQDLTQLTKSWQLTQYTEEQVEGAVPEKEYTFNEDGTYTLTVEGETSTGTWETNLSAAQAQLFLDAGTEQTLTIEIVTLTTDFLHLRYTQDDIVIEEQYQPVP
jgi:hypothetical protein